MSDREAIEGVLARFGLELARGEAPQRQGGGFSGAGVWRVETPAGIWCLRRWPEEAGPIQRLRGLHRALRHVARDGLTVLAVPVADPSGESLPQLFGRFWQLEPWMPGRSDFRERPTPARLEEAMRALARFHLAAARFEPLPSEALWFSRRPTAPSPAIATRASLIESWLGGRCARLADAIRRAVADPFRPIAERLLPAFVAAAPGVFRELAAGASLRVPLYPCLRDVWHDHLLFEGDALTGLIDPSACRTETAAADLSRLLGSLVGDHAARWEEALAAYERVRSLSLIERRLVRILDRSGVLLSGMTWLDRHYLQNAPIAPVGAVVERLSRNLERLEKLGGG